MFCISYDLIKLQRSYLSNPESAENIVTPNLRGTRVKQSTLSCGVVSVCCNVQNHGCITSSSIATNSKV